MRKHYSTLAELITAYHDHELTPETAIVELDKNEVTVTWHAADDEDWLRAETVYEGFQEDMLMQALDLLGIRIERELAEPLLAEVRALAVRRKRALTPEEIRALCRAETGAAKGRGGGG